MQSPIDYKIKTSFFKLDVQCEPCFIHVKWCLREIQIKMINLQNKMAVKVTKKVKYATTLYHKINVMRSKLYMESVMLFSRSAQPLQYAVLLLYMQVNVLGAYDF